MSNALIEFNFERYYPVALAISGTHGCSTVTVQTNVQQTFIAFALDNCLTDGV